jgi:hypothetical protein
MRKEENMTCRKHRKLLTPWLSGEFKPDKAAELKAWFDSCEAVLHCSVCRKLIDEHISFQRAFQSTPQGEFPAFLHYQIMDKIQSRTAKVHKKEIRMRWQTVPVTIAILLSFCVGSLVGVKTLANQTANTTESTETSNFGDNGMLTTLYVSGGTE